MSDADADADADEQEGGRRLALLAFAELSLHDLSSSSPLHADLPRLLRCCLALVPLLDADLAGRLRAFVRGILSSDPDRSLLPAVEVFAENFVVSDQLRRCFAIAHCTIPKGPGVSTMALSRRSELRVLFELMSYHFIASVQDEEGFEQFLSALSWSGKEMQVTQEIGLPAAISLLHKCCLFSMPIAVQAHFVLLASRCKGNGDLDPHLLAFEYARNVYLGYLPALGVFARTNGVKNPLNCFAKKRPFNSCVQDTIYLKLCSQINGLLSFCKLHSDGDLLANERNVSDTLVGFIEENQHFVLEQFRQKAVIAVKSIVSNILCFAEQKEMHELDNIVSEEIICIAAVLQLMGSSFLQILQCIRQMTVAGGRQNEKYLLLCQKDNFISETTSLFGQYEANELCRHDLFGMIGKPVDKDRSSVLMLAHFASLSVFCLRMRSGFLWKGCIIMMMASMNLVIAEEEKLGLFHCFDGSKILSFSFLRQGSNSKGSVWRKSSTAIALKFKNLHKVHIQDEVNHDFCEGSSLDNLERCKSINERDDGRAFFSCLPGYKHSEWDDISDFVECNPSIDYSSWWSQHKKFKNFMDKKWIRNKRLNVKKKK